MNVDWKEVLDRVPSREELMSAVTRDRRSGSHVGELLAVFGAGLVVGGTLALLLAPSSGRDLRAGVRDRAAHLRDEIDDRISGQPASDPGDHEGEANAPRRSA